MSRRGYERKRGGETARAIARDRRGDVSWKWVGCLMMISSCQGCARKGMCISDFKEGGSEGRKGEDERDD